MRIALVMLDQNYGGMQQDFLNYSIELSKTRLPCSACSSERVFRREKIT